MDWEPIITNLLCHKLVKIVHLSRAFIHLCCSMRMEKKLIEHNWNESNIDCFRKSVKTKKGQTILIK